MNYLRDTAHANAREEEVDHWIDLGPGLAARLITVSQTIGKAVQKSFKPEKVGSR